METRTALAAPLTANQAHTFHDTADDNAIRTLPPPVPARILGRRNTRAMQSTLYDVICCQCKMILNVQNIHCASYCLDCKHERCEECATQAV